MLNIQPFTKSHRTAIVFDARGALHEERAKRLIESVNGPNIKVDFFTLTDSGLAPGTVIVKAPVSVPAAGTPFDLAGAAVASSSAAHIHDEVRNALSDYDLVAIVA